MLIIELYLIIAEFVILKDSVAEKNDNKGMFLESGFELYK